MLSENVIKKTKNFYYYLGPALLVSIAYMDPGNFGTDLASGSLFKYDLIWSVWMASIIAMLLQYLSGKIGIATSKSLPELIRENLSNKMLVFSYWLASEVAIAATDLAEYLGTVIALNIILGIPLLIASIIAGFDVIIILAATTRKFRKLEQLFMILVSALVLALMYEAFTVGPNFKETIIHSFVPSISNYSILFVVGIIGATVMPHTLFLHSWLTKIKLNEHSLEEKRRLRNLHLTETVITLGVAAFVNVAILLVAVPLNIQGDISIYSAFDALKTTYGGIVSNIFVLAVFLSGLTSSIVGTLAGQVVMEGLLGIKINAWLRRIITRFINVFPTTIAILIGIDILNILVYSQVILSILLPLPMIPLLYYSSNKKIMGEFVNKRITSMLAYFSSAIIIAFNVYLISTLV